MEVKHFFEAIQILSPSTTMPCSIRGTNIEARHNPIVRTSIMSEFLVKNLLGNMPLILTNKLFKSPSGLIFECSGIVKDIPIEIDETEVHLDFPHLCQPWVWSSHRLPYRQTFQRKTFPWEPWWEVCKNCFRHPLKNSSGKALPQPWPVWGGEVHIPIHFTRAFLWNRIFIIILTQTKPCTSGPQNVVLVGGRDSTLILNDIFLESKNFCAMDILFSPTCPYEDHNHVSSKN